MYVVSVKSKLPVIQVEIITAHQFIIRSLGLNNGTHKLHKLTKDKTFFELLVSCWACNRNSLKRFSDIYSNFPECLMSMAPINILDAMLTKPLITSLQQYLVGL